MPVAERAPAGQRTHLPGLWWAGTGGKFAEYWEYGALVRRWLRRLVRAGTPAGLVLVCLCFLLPFVTVSCAAPGGFGRAAPGGASSYTGVDLVTGGAPTVTADRLRPAQQRREDRLPPQLLALAVLGCAAAGLGLAAARDVRLRRSGVLLAAGVGVVLHLANQYTVEMLLAARVREQLTVPMPAGKTAEDFVQTGPGFGAVLLLLVIVAVGNGIGLLYRHPPTAAPMAAGPTSTTGAD